MAQGGREGLTEDGKFILFFSLRARISGVFELPVSPSLTLAGSWLAPCLSSPPSSLSPLKMADAPSPAAPKQFTQQEIAKVRQQDPRASGPSSAASR